MLRKLDVLNIDIFGNEKKLTFIIYLMIWSCVNTTNVIFIILVDRFCVIDLQFNIL